MRQTILILLSVIAALGATAQNVVVEESATDVTCDSRTHVVAHFREVTTILNEQGAAEAAFVCSCSKNDRLTSFKGQVADASGRVIRKLKESELKRTEYSPYLAIDDYRMYLDYTPPTYPVTITYEWTVDSRDNVIEFPPFCPQSGYDISVRKAIYRLTAPKALAVRHALRNISAAVTTADDGKGGQVLTLELSDLPALRQEPYGRPLRERLPLAYFAPTDFVYYGTQGSLATWKDYGQWEYSLISGSEALPDAVRQELHQLADPLPTAREKVEALYRRLEQTTRYVAVLLGIGGQRPAPAASVCKSGFGDCKGLSNYMRAMLREVGIPSVYTTISTTNRRLLPDFASVGQMNHVILQVPLPGDTLWLECTNPQLPMGYVHEDIAGHDAIAVGEGGGRLVRLPVCPDTANLMRSTIRIRLDEAGAADVALSQATRNWQYENYIPLLRMDDKDRQKVLQRMVRVPQAEIGRIDVSEQQGAAITLDAEVRSRSYATVTGQRLFVPLCPIHRGYSAPKAMADRQEDIWIETGYLDEDDITLLIPEGFAIEAMPKNSLVEQPFGTFSFELTVEGREVRLRNRLLLKAGHYDKALYPQLIDFFKAVASAYGQRIVLKNSPKSLLY